eukprot:COSAG06_NODE_1261_length_10074_cov_21.232882_7_plen_97_part_00
MMALRAAGGRPHNYTIIRYIIMALELQNDLAQKIQSDNLSIASSSTNNGVVCENSNHLYDQSMVQLLLDRFVPVGPRQTYLHTNRLCEREGVGARY